MTSRIIQLLPVRSSHSTHARSKEAAVVFLAIMLAGLIGGAAEVVWVTVYSAFTSTDVAVVGREIVYSVLPFADAAATAVNGLIIHLALSLLLAYAFGLLVWHPLMYGMGLIGNLFVACVVLTLVWIVNFGVVLPVVNPVFVDLMPYSVTFVSKLLFGAAMGFTLYQFGGKPSSGRHR